MNNNLLHIFIVYNIYMYKKKKKKHKDRKNDTNQEQANTYGFVRNIYIYRRNRRFKTIVYRLMFLKMRFLREQITRTN